MFRMIGIVTISLLMSFAAVADDVLDIVSFIHDPADPIRTGIEVEFTGITIDEAILVVQKAIGGKVQYSDIPFNMTVMDEKGQIRDVDVAFHRGKLKSSGAGGPIVIKPEFNDTSGVTTLDEIYKSVIIELLSDPGPIRFPGVVELQKAMDALKEAGAIGTRADVAVSLQVNVEIGEGKRENVSARHLVNILRNYMRVEHRRQIMDRYQVPAVRLTYIQPLSPGFMAKLMDPTYDPTLEQLKDDAIYRQLKEFLGDKNAWTAPIEDIRREVIDYILETNAFASKDSPLFRVIKFSPVKIASLLLWLFPNDPLAALVTKHQWIKLIPAIEFRDRNNDFNVIAAVREAVGMVRASEKYGSFIFDPSSSLIPGFSFKEYTERQLKKMANRAGVHVKDMKHLLFTGAIRSNQFHSARSSKSSSTAAASVGGVCRDIFIKAN